MESKGFQAGNTIFFSMILNEIRYLNYGFTAVIFLSVTQYTNGRIGRNDIIDTFSCYSFGIA